MCAPPCPCVLTAVQVRDAAASNPLNPAVVALSVPGLVAAAAACYPLSKVQAALEAARQAAWSALTSKVGVCAAPPPPPQQGVLLPTACLPAAEALWLTHIWPTPLLLSPLRLLLCFMTLSGYCLYDSPLPLRPP